MMGKILTSLFVTVMAIIIIAAFILTPIAIFHICRNSNFKWVVTDKHIEKAHCTTTTIWTGKMMIINPVVVDDKYIVTLQGKCFHGYTKNKDINVAKDEYNNYKTGEVK